MKMAPRQRAVRRDGSGEDEGNGDGDGDGEARKAQVGAIESNVNSSWLVAASRVMEG
jgi:hypothetical protein